jgi:hypothetical protein
MSVRGWRFKSSVLLGREAPADENLRAAFEPCVGLQRTAYPAADADTQGGRLPVPAQEPLYGQRLGEARAMVDYEPAGLPNSPHDPPSVGLGREPARWPRRSCEAIPNEPKWHESERHAETDEEQCGQGQQPALPPEEP